MAWPGMAQFGQLLKCQFVKSGPLRWYSCLYVTRDLYPTACCGDWIIHSLPAQANRLAGLVDYGFAYSENGTNVWSPVSSSWGINKEIKLGIEDDETILQISVGRQHIAFLTSNGNVYTSTDYSRKLADSLKKVAICQGSFKQIACGLDHTLGLTTSGKVFSCGWGADGQTGSGKEATVTDFTPVIGEICHKNIVKISTCADSCFAIADDGLLFAWGNNEYGQLALNSSELQVTIPQQCQLPLLSGRIVDVASGGAFTCFLTDSSSIYCVGNLRKNRDQLHLLHEENNITGPITSLYAGLHYVVAYCRDVLLVWGSYPGAIKEPQPLKLPAPNDTRIHSISPMLHELVLIIDE